MWKKFFLCTALMCGVLGAGAARAISFETRDFDALAREAEQVVVGTATEASSRRTGEREIVTDYRFDNLEVIKGSVPGPSLTLTLLGGTVGADTLSVAGAPKFIAGVRYLVFVAGNGSVMFPMVGGQQGIFQIRSDAATGVARVHDYAGRPVTRLPVRGNQSLVDNNSTGSTDPAAGALTKDDFITAIKTRMAAQGAK